MSNLISLRALPGGSLVVDGWSEEPRWDREIQRHNPRVITTLLARGVAVERARELAQEAWAKVIRNYREGRLGEIRLPGVVVAQANFLGLDEQRRLQREAVQRADLLTIGATCANGLFEERAIARQTLRKISKIIDGTSPSARAVFYRLYGPEPQRPAEVARELGLSLQRVRQIACELRKLIRLRLGEGDHV